MPNASDVTLTDRAASESRKSCVKSTVRDAAGGYNWGGCSGFQYEFRLDNSCTDDDAVLSRDGAVVLIRPGVA